MGGKNGGFYAGAETLALAMDVPLRFRRKECEHCKKETIFRGLKCTGCGQCYKIPTPRGEVARFQKPQPLRDYLSRASDRKQRLLSDKQEYWKRKAEESRKKWEGK